MFAVAISGVLGFPLLAAADSSSVQIYGTLLPFLDNARTSSATAPGLSPANGGASQVPAAAYTGITSPGRNRITAGTSNIGFRGSEDLSDGLKAIFQVESQIPIDGDPAPPGTWAGRNSNVGLAGGFGTVFLGNWDTPYKWTTIAVSPLRGLNPFDYDNILENPGFNVPGTTTQSGRVNGKADAAFSRRQGNSVQYWTPNWSGFSARVAYSANEGKTTIPGGATISPSIWSVSVAYEQGPLVLRYAYEQHDDYFGMAQLGGTAGATATNSSSKDKANKLLGIYTIGGTRIAAVYERLQYDTDDLSLGAANKYKRDA
jgi:predicted porin